MLMWSQINTEGQGFYGPGHTVLFPLCWNGMKVGFIKKGEISPVFCVFLLGFL